jgi:hypothetical protein
MRAVRRPACPPAARIGAHLLLAAALFVAVTGLALVRAEPAAAACTGSGCNGLNPNSHCSTTGTPREWFIDATLTLQLRYSSGCSAYWGRAFHDCSYHPPPLHIRVERQLYTPYGYYRTHVYYETAAPPCNGDPGWTFMAGNYGSDRHRACVGYSYDGRAASAMPEDWWSWCTDQHGGWVY